MMAVTPVLPYVVADPGVAGGLLVAGGWYWLGVRRLWRGAGVGHGVSRTSARLYAAGLLVLAAALLSPLDALAEDLFSAHMIQHLLLITVAAPLLVLGRPLVAALWALPSRWRAGLGRWWGTRPGARTALAILGIPGVAWTMHALALALWHVPSLYDAALRRDALHAVEHVSFVVTACVFWWMVLPGTGRTRLGYGSAILSVTAMGAAMGIYGAVLTFGRSPWYSGHAPRTGAWGLTPLADQQLAGLIMWIPAGVVYLGAALWCFAEWLRLEGRRAAAAQVPAAGRADDGIPAISGVSGGTRGRR